MKRSKKQIQIRLKQGASFLLVLLFLSIAAAPVLDDHNDGHRNAQEQHKGSEMYVTQVGYSTAELYNWAAEQSGTQEQLQRSDKCSVCDYYHHIQGKQIFSHYLLELPAIFSKVISTSPHLLTGNYKITVQGFTNKGPPPAF
ncbi:hypothetical protein AQ505_11200 [Pedobacter sp. PACM 27299]|uniref:hypothetical protein n=1 Tax=Pedobacter sp. PACM 27299 TaxID=1727164 RepID=UPI000705FC6B|nr:hypothetical protein [Pedobacter sp. PACM 27299]ALL06008.1 hypothetical protein AQ505_11200 [Pedobacter sp. PACM 27299]